MSKPASVNERHALPRARELQRTAATPLPLPDVILTRSDVAAWLQVRPREVARLGVPQLDLGRKTKRYLAAEVAQWLKARTDRPGEKDTASCREANSLCP